MHGPGSPPRGRGKVDGPPAQVGRGRITPAQAGRSPYFLYGKKDYKDHPRIGGEKAELTAAVISAMGSPPRRRGKGYREFGIDISDRITPAQAGKSVAPRQKRSALWDHPAWAGKSQLLVPALAAEWDHPRVGGEKLGGNEDEIQDVGSPPRGRGKGLTASASWTSTGITPAWAGKRRQDVKGYSRVWDHPRVGGEKLGKISAPNIGQGSPPRGRGKEYAQKAAVATGGITPAWAGKSLGHAVAQGCTRDHPRVGGEKSAGAGTGSSARGSPPRGRGKEAGLVADRHQLRITPAWAGKRPTRPFRASRT